MAEEMKREDVTFQELLVGTEARVFAKDSTFRVISPKPKTTPVVPVMPSTHVASCAHPVRDWAAAVDLVNEAAEAVRLADERAQAAERQSQELADYYGEKTKTAEARIAILESRIKSSEAKVREAEEWLVRFHDAIMAGFGTSTKKPG